MSNPRIDSTRNLIDQWILLLAEFRAELHDIHDLANNRTRAAEEAKVRGGQPDFCLDTHGDRGARDRYTSAVREMVHHAGPVESAIKAIRSYLTADGKVRKPAGFDSSKVAPKAEVAAAIARAERNLGRSSVFDRERPHLIAAQPQVGYVDPTTELALLRNAVLKMAKGVKPDRSRLTPQEQDAWRKATSPEQIDKAG